MERPKLDTDDNDLLDEINYLLEIEKYCDFLETENKKLRFFGIKRSKIRNKGIRHYKEITKHFKNDLECLDDYEKYKYLKKEMDNIFWQGFYVE